MLEVSVAMNSVVQERRYQSYQNHQKYHNYSNYRTYVVLCYLINVIFLCNLICIGLAIETSDYFVDDFRYSLLTVKNNKFISKYTSDFVCPICLEESSLNLLDKTVSLSCEHTFHDTCINQWIRSKPTCPMCRNKCF